MKNISIIEHQQKYTTNYRPPSDYKNDKKAFDSFRFVKKFIPIKGDYLDIGCGFGSVLYFFKTNGWNVKGIELSPELAKHVEENLHVEVDVCDFLQYKNNNQFFDLVSLRHVLEHLPDSNLALTQISGLLKENGYVHLEFPNINSLTHRLQRFRNRFGIIRKKYATTYVPGHCNEFSKESFQFLIRKNNFKLIRWETYSSKPFPNLIYNHFHIGTKVRAIIQKL